LKKFSGRSRSVIQRAARGRHKETPMEKAEIQQLIKAEVGEFVKALLPDALKALLPEAVKAAAVDLLKRVGLGPHFGKASAHHAALAEEHKAHGEFCKARHEAADDSDANKGFFGKAAEHHAKKADLHKAHAGHLAELCAAYTDGSSSSSKAAGVTDPPPPPNAAAAGPDGIDGIMQKAVQGLVEKRLEALQTDPAFTAAIDKAALARVELVLSQKLQPTEVKAVVDPSKGSKPIPRTGGATPADAIDTKGVAPELEEMVSSG